MLDFTNPTWDFPVELQETFDRKGNKIKGNRVVVRTDTGEHMSRGVGDKYKIITHSDVVNSIMDSIDDVANTLGTAYEEKIHIIDGGRKLRGEINFPDWKIEPVVDDICTFRIQFYNSYDTSWAFQHMAEAFRLWCKNGCTTPNTVAKTWAKHTTNVSVTASSAKILAGFEAFKQSDTLFKSYVDNRISYETAEMFINDMLCKVKQRGSLGNPHFNMRRREELLRMWDENRAHIGNNQWALYNTLTEWATHTDHLGSPENARRLRENEIAKAMNSDRWYAL
jgi:hypothetical protein|tara:strand:- start:1302 stop:2144 length:843 start_codon:yes stop_codon:yes gene_type:complete